VKLGLQLGRCKEAVEDMQKLKTVNAQVVVTLFLVCSSKSCFNQYNSTLREKAEEIKKKSI
jgi:hypothetical protein